MAVYLQLIQQAKDGARLGYLAAGDQLPTVREVAAHLLVSPNTVVKAYRELEREGFVTSRPALGTFMTGAIALTPAATRDKFRLSLERWISQAEGAGLERGTIAALFTEALRGRFAEGVA